MPRDLVEVSIGLQVLRLVREDASTAGRVVDVGDAADDLVAGLRGFHGAERDADGRSFRWSGDVASLAVAGADRVALEVAGGRPAAAPPAEISVWAGPHRVADGLAVGNGRQTITLELPASERAGTTELTIRSNAFRPVALDISPDRRSLGIRVYRVEVLRGAPGDPSAERPAPDVAP